MIQALPDFFLAHETLMEDHVTLKLEVRNFEHDGATVVEVAGTEEGRHATAREGFDQFVLIECLTRG
jgi:uncharacterized protein YkuJ